MAAALERAPEHRRPVDASAQAAQALASLDDALLCMERLRPDVWYGPASALVLDELGDDAPAVLGDHADTFYIMAAAVLGSHKGERGLRAILRHLRALLGRSPTCSNSRELLKRVGELEGRVALQVTELAMAERHLAGERFAAQRAMAAEQKAWAAERSRLLENADRRVMAAGDGHAELVAQCEGLRRTMARNHAHFVAQLAEARRLQARDAAERTRFSFDLGIVHQMLAERESQLFSCERQLAACEQQVWGFTESLSVGKSLLNSGGSSRGGFLEPSGPGPSAH